MKHTWKITIMLVAFFILAQVVGLWLLNLESQVSIDTKTNETVINYSDTAVGPRPETRGSGSLIYILAAVFIGTLLVLLIVKYGKVNIWKTWFFLAVWMALSVAIGVFTHKTANLGYGFILDPWAMIIALPFVIWKIFKPNIIVHNVTEVLMYAGIALILVPLFGGEVLWVIILLVIMSLYDMYAVWKSKHMVKMAKFQSKSELFAGLKVPYGTPPKKVTVRLSSSKTMRVNERPKVAILGGGDIAFPLIFIGTVMSGLIIAGLSKSTAFLQSSIIIFTTAVALLLLFIFAKKDRFYPAMPFITAGCLIGWAITLLL
jgi:presenilin-like A22 family membrane protease